MGARKQQEKLKLLLSQTEKARRTEKEIETDGEGGSVASQRRQK